MTEWVDRDYIQSQYLPHHCDVCVRQWNPDFLCKETCFPPRYQGQLMRAITQVHDCNFPCLQNTFVSIQIYILLTVVKCHTWLFMFNKMHVKWLSMMQDNGHVVQIMAKVNYWWKSNSKEQCSCQTCLILHAWTFKNAKTTCCEEVTCCLCSTLCCTYTLSRKIFKMYVNFFFKDLFILKEKKV